jgi:hypothetical protein
MDDGNDKKSLVVRVAQLPVTELRDREAALLAELEAHGLPTAEIFVDFAQRAIVFQNVGNVIQGIPDAQRASSVYVSKFVAAVSAGLFDAALNYLWDETVSELRRRVAAYDLSYFYDHAIKNEERRKQFKSESDLQRVEDQELINAAREIELISEIGYKQIDLIRYMRNWASAAHPNQNQIDGLTLISYLNTCIKEVIALPFSANVIKIKQLLENIKKEPIAADAASEIGSFFLELTQDQTNALAQGFFGIYTRRDSDTIARNNVGALVSFLWPRIDEDTRRRMGVKYAQFAANSQQAEKQNAAAFLEIVGGENYAPDNIRVAQISTTLEDLVNAHRAMNNFYNEPVFARELRRVVGTPPAIPRDVENRYVSVLCDVFLTNGNGVARNAEVVYRDLIQSFTSQQALKALLSFTDRAISSKLQVTLCGDKFVELLALLEPHLTSAAARELLVDLRNFTGPRDKMVIDAVIKRKLDAIRQVLSK